MNVALGIIFFSSAMLIALGGFIFSIYKNVLLVKDKRKEIPFLSYCKAITIGDALFTVFFMLSLFSIYLWTGYSPTWYNVLQVLFGGLIFGGSLSFGTSCFITHYYRKEIKPSVDKRLFITLMVSIPLVVISFFLWCDGFADVAGYHYLLPNGLSFTNGFVNPSSGAKPNIAFYAICILSGAVFVYFLCDHLMYKEYGKHGTLEITFLTAFPAGILGARIAYVIGNWTKDGFAERFARGEWWSIFAIWEGGLTILGGAIAGILVGALVYKKTNKGRSLFRAADLIVPTILIAQAVGRWGNFFNCEVHGGLVSESSWYWIPRFILNNARYSATSGWAPDGMIYAPLFFIEFLTNILGYFVIAYLFGHACKKILVKGDLALGYIIWYGFTRIFMEPLRDNSYKMGSDNYWSWMWSLIFVGGGALLIAINHFVRFLMKKETTLSFKTTLVGAISLSSIMVAMLSTSIYLLSSGTFATNLALSSFNVGIILLVTSISLLLLAIPCYIEAIYIKRHQPIEA